MMRVLQSSGMEATGSAKGAQKGAACNKSVSRSVKAGHQFPFSHIVRYLKKGRYAHRIGSGGPVYLATALEHLAAEVMESAGNAAKDNKKKTINPRHVCLAVRTDVKLGTFLGKVTIAHGGVMPNIHSVLLPKNVVEKGEGSKSPKKVVAKFPKKVAAKSPKKA